MMSIDEICWQQMELHFFISIKLWGIRSRPIPNSMKVDWHVIGRVSFCSILQSFQNIFAYLSPRFPSKPMAPWPHGPMAKQKKLRCLSPGNCASVRPTTHLVVLPADFLWRCLEWKVHSYPCQIIVHSYPLLDIHIPFISTILPSYYLNCHFYHQ